MSPRAHGARSRTPWAASHWRLPTFALALALPSLTYAERTVRTVGTADEDARLPSGFVTRLTLAEDDQAGGLAGALERAPGVTINRQSSWGQAALARVRGGTPRQLMILLNGVPLRAPAGLGFDVGSLSVDAVDTARVYRGPAAIVWGAGSLSGAIALESGAPRAPDAPSARVTLHGGSFGALGASAHALAPLGRGASVKASAWMRRATGDYPFVDAQGTPLTRVNNDHTRLGASIAARAPVANGRLDATALFDGGERGVAGPAEFQEVFDAARAAERRAAVTSAWRTRDLAAGEWGAVDARLISGLQWRGSSYENTDALIGGARIDQAADAVGFMGAGELSAYVGGVNFSTLRAELRREGFAQRAQGEGAAARVVGAISAQRTRAALAIADEHLLFDGALRLNASARFDGVEDAEASSTPSRALLPTVALGVVANPTDWLELRANGARTARPPDLDELYLETEVARGDPDLRPEVALTLDAGARLNLDNASMEAVYFQSDTDDEIFFTPVTAYLFEAQNLTSVVRRGVEVSGEARWGRVDVWGRYGWTRARLDSADPSPLSGVPEHTGSLRVTASLGGWGPFEAQDAIGVEAGGSWRSEVFLDLFGRRSNPAWLSVDAAAWVGPWEGWRVRVDGTNLLDYRGAVDGRQRPLPGRAFHVSLSHRLGETNR